MHKGCILGNKTKVVTRQNIHLIYINFGKIYKLIIKKCYRLFIVDTLKKANKVPRLLLTKSASTVLISALLLFCLYIPEVERIKAATIKEALISLLRDRWKVEVANGPDMEIQGNIQDHEYKIEAGKEKVAEVLN